MTPPDIGQIDDGAGGVDGVQMFKTVQDNRALLDPVKRFAEGVAEGPAQKDAAWWLHLFGIVSDDGDTDGSDAGFFNNPLYQSHGLITDPSAGG